MIHQTVNRRSMLRLGAAGAGLVVATRYGVSPAWAQVPPLEEKETYTIGFAQTDLNNPWRLAESKSMQDEAARLGYTLVETNAHEDTAKQIADVDSLIAQGVDILIFPPRESQALLGYAAHDGLSMGLGYLGAVDLADPVELLAQGKL